MGDYGRITTMSAYFQLAAWFEFKPPIVPSCKCSIIHKRLVDPTSRIQPRMRLDY